jgi:hypothetical protein
VWYSAKPLKQIQPSEVPTWPGGNPNWDGVLSAVYRYSRQPVPLEVELMPVTPVVEARVVHQIQVSRTGLSILSEFTVDVSRANLHVLELDWPRELKLLDHEKQRKQFLNTNWNAAEKKLRLDLWVPKPARSGEPRVARHVFQLESELSVPSEGADWKAICELPMLKHGFRRDRQEPIAIQASGGEVKLKITDDLEAFLLPGTRGIRTPGGRPVEVEERLRGSVAYQLSSRPADPIPQVALAWKPRSVPVNMDVETILMPRETIVWQTLRFQIPGSELPGAETTNTKKVLVWLRVPRGLEALQIFPETSTVLKRPALSQGQWSEALAPPEPSRLLPRLWELQAIALPPERDGSYVLTVKYRLPQATFAGGRPAGDSESADGTGHTLTIPLLRTLHVVTPQSSIGLSVEERDARARFWVGSTAFQLVAEDDSAWSNEPLIAPTGLSHLPSLELKRRQAFAPLRVRCQANPAGRVGDAVAERVLIEVHILPNGQTEHHLRYWLSQLRTDQLRIALPPGNFALHAHDEERVRLRLVPARPAAREASNRPQEWDQVQVVRGIPVEVQDQADHSLLRVHVPPHFITAPAVLEVSYRLNRESDHATTLVHHLPVPTFENSLRIGTVRWQVRLPAGMMPLGNNKEYRTEQDWQMNSWTEEDRVPGPVASWLSLIRPPQPKYLAEEMDRWFWHGEPAAAESQTHRNTEEDPALSYTAQGTLVPLRIVHVAQNAWMVVCSLLVLVLGVGLYGSPPRLRWVWLILALVTVLGLGVMVDSLLHAPGETPVSYRWWGAYTSLATSLLLALAFGGQAGFVVLVIVVLFWWIRQRRWRRRIVLLPGFTRMQPGSSVQRGKPARPLGEPSTVDQPKSSESPAAELQA